MVFSIYHKSVDDGEGPSKNDVNPDQTVSQDTA